MTGDRLPIRVTLLDTLDGHAQVVSSATPVEEIKRAALSRSGIRRPASEYVVKYRGAELFEGGKTLGDAGVVANAALIVLPRRRIPAR
jgi:hypothetical protein